jgi:transposase-like protein|tara:strand:+ start:104 stop:334 length:231 start_codon:yes stop_codon:yes gene_type:complete
MEEPFLTTEQLAERYGIKPVTVKRWRRDTRAGKPIGPNWYELPIMAVAKNAPRVRYPLAQVLAWEETNSITPINHF